MTFEEFVASKKWCDHLPIDELEVVGNDNAGYMYNDSFWIARHGYDPARLPTQWYLLIGNQDWLDPDLAKLERILWEDFAEGEINGPCRRNGHRDTGRGVCADCGEVIHYGRIGPNPLIDGCWDDDANDGDPPMTSEERAERYERDMVEGGKFEIEHLAYYNDEQFLRFVRNIDDGTPIPGTTIRNDHLGRGILVVTSRAEVVAWLKERNK